MTALMTPGGRIAGDREVAHLSPSIAKILVNKSPMHAWDAHRLGGNHQPEPTDAQSRGRLLDMLFFGDTHRIAVIDAPDWRTKAAKEARDAAEMAGKVAVLAHKMQVAERAVFAWNARLDEMGVMLTGESQKRLFWYEGGTPCKGILDHLFVARGEAIIFDLKTCEDASLSACERSFVSLGHDIQAAAYRRAVEANYPEVAGRIRTLFLFCETDRPYAVNVVEPSGDMSLVGERKWRYASLTWGECLRTGTFPGYNAGGVARIEAKPWHMDSSLELVEGVADGCGDGE